MAMIKSLVQMADTGSGTKKKEAGQQSSTGSIGAVAAQAAAGAVAGALPAKKKAATVTPAQNSGGRSGGGDTAAPAPVAAAAEPLPASSYQESSDQTRALYDQAAKALADKMAARPSWDGSSYDAEIDDLYAQITGRGQFRYSLNDDALWQQLKDSYMNSGKAAMRDTMGQAAALTGGYGSSYAQSVGQQAYDREMERLLDVAPELEGRAYQRWTDEGDELKDRLGLARSLADDEWDKYLAEDDRWRDERNFAASERDTAYGNWLTERAYGDSRTEANRERIIQLIAIGYPPSDRELADAGMSRAEYAAIAAQYAPQPASGGGGGSSGGGGGKQKASAYDEALSAMQQAIKEGADQYEINTAIAANTSLTAAERKKLMEQNNAPISDRYIFDK